MEAEGKYPEQESVDETRDEARLEALNALCDLERCLRGDDGVGGMDAIRIGVLSHQVSEKVRVYRMTVNIGDEPTLRTELADHENGRRRGVGRRRQLGL